MKIIADPRLYPSEVEQLVDFEVKEKSNLHAEISLISLIIEGDEVVVETTIKSPITRVRRITGYLSNIDNFNNGKRAECADRRTHTF